MKYLPESDWKKVRAIHPVLLQRMCKNVFQEVEAISSKASSNYHK